MRVVDVQARAVGEDRRSRRPGPRTPRSWRAGMRPAAPSPDGAGFARVVRQQRRVGRGALQVEAAGVVQRVLVVVVPAGLGPRTLARRRVHGDDVAGQQHRVGQRASGLEDPVLGLDPHHAAHGHATTLGPRATVAPRTSVRQRYCPVLVTFSMVREPSAPFLPWTIVRMKTMRSPFLPEMRAQSSGLVVLGRSSFSLNSSTHAVSRCSTRMPRWPVGEEVLDRRLLRPVDDVLDHRARVEVLEVQDLLVAARVGDLEEPVLLALGVHPLDDARDHRLDGRRGGRRRARRGRRRGSAGRRVRYLREDLPRALGVGPLDLDLHVEPARAAGSPGRSCPRGSRRR